MEIPTTTFVSVSKFRFHGAVRDADGAGGSLAALFVAAETRAVTALSVRFGVFGHVVIVPVAQVSAATDEGIELSATRASLEKSGPKQVSDTRLDAGATVTLNGKRLGKLAQLSVNTETHVLRHLIVEHGLGQEVVVAADAVEQIGGNAIGLVTRDGASARLTPYRPDVELREDARKAIESYARLRVDLDGVNISASDGVIWLRGYVSSELNRRLIGDLVSGVHGLGELRNELITDPELASIISQALARDPRTAEERIGVYPTLGRVRLRGNVHTAEAREAAEQLARLAPGVGEVVNELHVNSDANVLPVMASVTNNEDAVPGGR